MCVTSECTIHVCVSNNNAQYLSECAPAVPHKNARHLHENVRFLCDTNICTYVHLMWHKHMNVHSSQHLHENVHKNARHLHEVVHSHVMSREELHKNARHLHENVPFLCDTNTCTYRCCAIVIWHTYMYCAFLCDTHTCTYRCCAILIWHTYMYCVFYILCCAFVCDTHTLIVHSHVTHIHVLSMLLMRDMLGQVTTKMGNDDMVDCAVSVSHCNTLQHAATRCNTLQHTVTHLHKDGQWWLGWLCGMCVTL